MSEVIAFLLGGCIAALLTLLYQQNRHARARLADERLYKHRWEEALRLMPGEGRLTEDQVALILSPGTPSGKQLAMGQGKDRHRCRTEVLRAKTGLPPADGLQAMSSKYVRRVHAARIKYGTVR